MSFEKLEAFIVLTECRSFTEAAHRLYCSQPTISNYIRQLEEMYGTALINRESKDTFLTEKGKMLYQQAKKMMELMEETNIIMTEKTNTSLTINASHYIGTYVLPQVLTQFQHTYKKLPLEINTYGYQELYHQLQEQKLHYAYMPIYEEDAYIQSHFDKHILFEDQFVLIVSKNHPLRKRKVIYKRDIERENLLMPQSQYIRQHVLTLLKKNNIFPSPVYMSSFEVVKQSVKSGLGIAFLPYRSVMDDISSAELCMKDIQCVNISRKNGLIVRKDHQLLPMDMDFFHTMKRILTADEPNYLLSIAK